MKKIFAYTKDQKISKPILAALLEAGYIPISVDSFDCIRVIEPIPDLPLADTSIIFASALEAMRKYKQYGSEDVKQLFANRILDRASIQLSNQQEPSETLRDQREPSPKQEKEVI